MHPAIDNHKSIYEYFLYQNKEMFQSMVTHIQAGAHKEFFCNQCEIETIHANAVGFENQFLLKGTKAQQRIPKATVKTWICNKCGINYILTVQVNGVNNDGTGLNYINVYPERREGWIRAKTFKAFEDTRFKELKKCYEQSISAYNNKLDYLSIIGLRACLEWICVEKGANEQNLSGKIKQVHDWGHITPAQKQIIDKITALGNATAHGLKEHSRKTIKVAIETIESIIHSVYEVAFLDLD